MSTASSPSPWQAARIELPDGRRSWTVLDDRGDIVECCRRWIVHLEQTHASPNTVRAYVRHVVEFANFLSANDAGLHQATVPLYDSFLAWRLATRKDALPSPRLVLLGKQATRSWLLRR
ncbi:site-specific integrase, partial [Sphingobium fuliginis]|uniref:site-specific integrase n=1 Tax=Sphingobium fuliginis (strain ATCC 27551) TaxID=336203 RepID=UPI0020C80FA1